MWLALRLLGHDAFYGCSRRDSRFLPCARHAPELRSGPFGGRTQGTKTGWWSRRWRRIDIINILDIVVFFVLFDLLRVVLRSGGLNMRRPRAGRFCSDRRRAHTSCALIDVVSVAAFRFLFRHGLLTPTRA